MCKIVCEKFGGDAKAVIFIQITTYLLVALCCMHCAAGLANIYEPSLHSCAFIYAKNIPIQTIPLSCESITYIKILP